MTLAALSWALVVATYKRDNILLRCIRQAIEQSRPPTEIIIVDGSPDWEKTRDRVMAELATTCPEIRWIYVPAKRPSSTEQRNQGIRLARADILFVIDDDSLLYSDCAEQILRIYEADESHAVAGVNAMHVPQAPDQPFEARDDYISERGSTKRYGLLARLIRFLLRADDIFVPYDAEFPCHPIPAAIRGLRIGTRPLMAGWGMTFRRAVCLNEPFEETLSRYAAGEDSDMGYRASRHGLLLTALEARLCHVGAEGGRLPPYIVALLGNLNPLVLHRLYSTNLKRSRRRLVRLMARRFFILLCKDLASRKMSLPNARGLMAAWGQLDYVFSRSEAHLRAWYPEFQKRLIEKSVSRPHAADF
jgi:glycosyltransferase involved in cell wall biosynthesis